jgi:MFS family permease
MPAEKSPSPPATLSWRALIVLGLLSTLYVLAAVDRQILAVMVDPIRATFRLSDTQLGLLSGFAFALVYALAAFPAARLADRYRRITLIAGGLALWSLCTGLFALARSWWQLVLCRMGVGLGEACLSPAAVSLLADYFPARNLGKAVAVYILAVPVGNGMTGLLGSVMLDSAVAEQGVSIWLLGAVQSWQLLLLLLSVAGFGLLALFMVTVREPTRRHKAAAPGDAALDHSLAAFGRHLATHAAVYGALALVMLTSALMYFGVGYWIPSYFTRDVQAAGMTAGDLLFYWGLIGTVVGSLGVLAGGYLSDYLSARHADGMWRALGIGTLLLGLGFTTFSFGGSQPSALLLLVPGVFGNGILQAAGITAVLKISPAHMRGQMSALYFLLVNLVGAGLGPTLVAGLGEFVFGGESGLALAMAATAFITSLASLLLLMKTAGACQRVQTDGDGQGAG